MAHWTQRRQRSEAYAKAKKNGFYVPVPQTPEEQARIASAVNKVLAQQKNVQLQLT